VEETATNPRDSLFKYFASHILPSNSPAIRTALTNLSSPYHACPRVVYKAKTFYLKKIVVTHDSWESRISLQIAIGGEKKHFKKYPKKFIKYLNKYVL
jgi:hypothetical protein